VRLPRGGRPALCIGSMLVDGSGEERLGGGGRVWERGGGRGGECWESRVWGGGGAGVGVGGGLVGGGGGEGWGGGGKCVRESRRVRCSVLRLAHAERGRRGEAETLHCALCARMSEPPAAAVEVEAGHLVFIIYIFESICQ